jgi:radical SAM superfamily enzyme YgiQ (UPF0313 family)
MLKKTRESIRRFITSETPLVTPKSSAYHKVALVFPNTYRLGMSNLGLLSVYRMLNARTDTLCERAFLLDSGEVFSLESRLPLRDFDIIAFSVSFEADYLHIPRMLHRAGIAPRSADRSAKDPLVIAGGVATFINPAPVSDFIDLFLVGEAEGLLGGVMDCFGEAKSSGKDAVLDSLSRIEGIYVPFLHREKIARGEGITQHWVPYLNDIETCSSIIARETEFGGKFLVEVSRGCPRGCRFCAARYVYRQMRVRDADHVIRSIEKGLKHTDQVGLVGASVSDYPYIDELCGYLSGRNVKVSISSLRIDSAKDGLLKMLAAGGQRMITVAPEAGTDRLRSVIGKGITADQIAGIAHRAKACGLLELKLYYIYGLPTETEADIAGLVEEVKMIGAILPVKAHVSPFVPKPHTPFQWCGMASREALKEKLARIKSMLKHDRRVEVSGEGVKNAFLEAAICRGGGTIADLIGQGNAAELIRSEIPFRTFGLDERLPWDFIRNGVGKDFLQDEYRKAMGVKS